MILATNKYQISSDVVIDGKRLPQGIVLTVTNFTSNFQYTKLKLRTIIAKPVINECYSHLNEDDYLNISYRRKRYAISYTIKGAVNVEKFLEYARPFNSDYVLITSIGKLDT